MPHPIVVDSIQHLKDCLEISSGLKQGHYTHQENNLFPHGTYGAHLRHVVEFYFCFQEGLKHGEIDYSLRRRDRSIEESLDQGLKALHAAIEGLERLSDDDLQLDLSLRCENDETKELLKSCCLRELEYLVHHSVHHYALMAAQLRHQKLWVPHHFGVARSTLRYLASCAP